MSSHAERLQQLQEMGFSEQQARAGLAKFSNNVGRAVEWLFEATPDEIANLAGSPPARANSPTDIGPAPPSPPMNDSPRLSPSKAVKGWLTAAEHDTADSAPLDPTKLSEDDQLRLAIEESLRDSSGLASPPSGVAGDTGSGASSMYGGFGAFAPSVQLAEKRARSRQRTDGSASPARATSAGLGPPPPPPRPARSALSTRPHSPAPRDDTKGMSEHIEHHEPAGSVAIAMGDKNPFRGAVTGGREAETDTRQSLATLGHTPPNSDGQTEPAPADAAPDYELPSYDAVVPQLPSRPYQPSEKDTDMEAALALSLQTHGLTDRDGDMDMADVSSPKKVQPRIEEERGVRTDAGLIPEAAPDRPEGAPLAYVSDNAAVMWLICVLQCLQAVPQVREAIEHLHWRRSLNMDDLSEVEKTVAIMQDLFRVVQGHRATHIKVDESLLLDCNFDWTNGMGLHARCQNVVQVIAASWLAMASHPIRTLTEDANLIDLETRYDVYLQHPDALFHSSVIPPGQDRPDQNASVLNILHDAATEKTGMQCIAKAIWNPQGAHMLCSLGDVFCVTVGKAARAYGQGVVETMQIDETVYLDRFLQSNTAASFSCRGREGVIKGDVQRKEALLAELDTIKTRNVEQTLTAAISYYESGISGGHMPEAERAAKVQQISSQLKQVKEIVASRKTEIREQIKALQAELDALWEVPELRKHRFDLRSIAYYKGFDSPTSYHTYVKQPDNRWWKVCATEATEVTFGSIQKDATGLHFDQGPFIMVYSREGPRPSEAEMPFIDTLGAHEDLSASTEMPPSPIDIIPDSAASSLSVTPPPTPTSADAEEITIDSTFGPATDR